MSKKWVRGGRYPEGTAYLVEVKTPRLKKTKDGMPKPPPNFPPVDLGRTSDLDHPPILSGAQGMAQALENKED